MAMMVEYPEFPWHPWAFAKSPRNWWSQLEEIYRKSKGCDGVIQAVIREYLDELGLKHELGTMADWNDSQVRRKFPNDRLHRVDSIEMLLKTVYPATAWKFSTNANQGAHLMESFGHFCFLISSLL